MFFLFAFCFGFSGVFVVMPVHVVKRKGRLKPTTIARDTSKKVSGCKNPSTVVEFAASSSLYDEAPIHATRGHSIAGRLERRRRGSARKADSACAARIAPAGALLYEPGTRRPHAANDRASQRGLSTTYRQNTAAMAEPHTFYGCCRATNAAHHGGSRARTARAQTRRRGDKGDSGRDGFGHRRAGGGAAGA